MRRLQIHDDFRSKAPRSDEVVQPWPSRRSPVGRPPGCRCSNLRNTPFRLGMVWVRSMKIGHISWDPLFLILCGSMKIKNIPRLSYNFVTICYNLLNYDIQFVIHIYYWDNDITNWDNDVTGCLGMVKYGFSVYACYLVKDVVCAYIYIYILNIYIYTIDRV